VCQGILNVEISQPHSVGLLWTSDQPDAEVSTWQHTTLIRYIHAPGVFRTRNLSKWAVARTRLRLRGYWDRRKGGMRTKFRQEIYIQISTAAQGSTVRRGPENAGWFRILCQKCFVRLSYQHCKLRTMHNLGSQIYFHIPLRNVCNRSAYLLSRASQLPSLSQGGMKLLLRVDVVYVMFTITFMWGKLGDNESDTRFWSIKYLVFIGKARTFVHVHTLILWRFAHRS
jgi:hypothetical protein